MENLKFLKNIQVEPTQRIFKHPIYLLRNDEQASIQQKAIDFIPTPSIASATTTSLDPRLFDSPRNQRLVLDVPPWQTQGTQPMTDIYDGRTGNKTGYNPDYESITGGQIYYYSDIDNDLPYSTPPFNIPAYVIPQVLVDPMGGRKFYYERIPMLCKQNAQYEYSFDQDQCEFREDLLARQQQIFYTGKFGAYQFFQNPQKYYPMV